MYFYGPTWLREGQKQHSKTRTEFCSQHRWNCLDLWKQCSRNRARFKRFFLQSRRYKNWKEYQSFFSSTLLLSFSCSPLCILFSSLWVIWRLLGIVKTKCIWVIWLKVLLFGFHKSSHVYTLRIQIIKIWWNKPTFFTCLTLRFWFERRLYVNPIFVCFWLFPYIAQWRCQSKKQGILRSFRNHAWLLTGILIKNFQRL